MTSKGEGVSLVAGFVVLLGMFAGTLLYVRELQGRALMRIAHVEQAVAEVAEHVESWTRNPEWQEWKADVLKGIAECACADRRQLPDQPTP